MKKILVAYFSASGETAKLAKTIAGVVDGDLFEIAPEVPYTAADLDCMDKGSRSTAEMNDDNSRPAIASKLTDMTQCLLVFPSGGIKHRASLKLSWKATILPEKPWSHSPPPAAAVWAKQTASSRRSAPQRRGCPVSVCKAMKVPLPCRNGSTH